MEDYLEKITKKKEPSKEAHPQYEPPMIITYDGDDIIEELGPAQTCSGDPCPSYP